MVSPSVKLKFEVVITTRHWPPATGPKRAQSYG